MKENSIEYIFRIDVFKPDDAPMLRVAEYLLEFARLLDVPEHVHLEKVSASSLNLHASADYVAEPRIQERLAACQEKGSDAYKVQHRINSMLARDNAIGELYRKPEGEETAKIIYFPGRELPKQREFKVKQQGSIEGILVRLGGIDTSIHGALDIGNGQYQKCSMSKALAYEVALHMFREPLRLHGDGTWHRDEEGAWHIEDFKAKSFEVLSNEALPEALLSLKEIPLQWGEDMTQELRQLREDD